MRFVCYCAAVLLAAFVTGCAVSLPDHVPIEKIQIASRFDTVEVTGVTFGTEANKCIPQLNENSWDIRHHLRSFPNKNIVGFWHVKSASIFVVHQKTVMCLRKSSAEFPIYASEIFAKTANPMGVPPDVLDEWYKQIARLIATKGRAKVAYVFANGNAFSVSYWYEYPHDIGLHYSSALKKAGTWETEKFDIQFSHPMMTSFSETKIEGTRQMTFPLARRSL